jgi:signal transduction histidine kinase/DNA-binding response OmpR family regulator
MNEEMRREAMFHDNVVVEIRSADDSNDKQISDLKYFADNGFDVIIASPNEAHAVTPTIEQIYDRGIPVIIFDRETDSDKFTAFRGADNREIGESAAKYALNLVDGDINVIEIQGLMGSTPAIDRQRGFDSVAEQNPRLNVVAHADAEWFGKKATAAADTLLHQHPDVNLIYAHNDRMAIAASEVARRMGRLDIKVIGIDAAPAIGIRAVADSVINATFIYPTMGGELIKTALNILEGKPYDRIVMTPTQSAVDLSNADILILQDKALREETSKIVNLKASVDDYWSRHTTQTVALYAVFIILILSTVLIFVLLKAYWSHNRHRRVLDKQNSELQAQRDRLNELYEQLKDATHSKLMFFTNVSHDLRTPLTLIADPVEQLAEAKNLTEQQHQLMNLANKNVKILMRLINQILDFRKYENGKLELNLSEVDVGAAVFEWCRSFRNIAIKRHIRLSVNVPDSSTAAIDAEKAERIVFNLLSNAFKFTPENGLITVNLVYNATSIIFSVQDSGRGMTDDEQRQVFDRFYQVDKLNPNGSGIGLALVKAFVTLHDGEITVNSSPGQGSTFTVTIPLRHVDKVAETPSQLISEDTVTDELAEHDIQQPDIDEKATSVLIIDDNEDIRSLIRGLLGDKYAVIRAANGVQGVKLATKYIPDLIICDVIMPGIDGLETCRRIKNEVSTSHIPVLMLTACSLDEQRVQGYESGADAYLSKPFSSKVLIARCESLIANRRLIRQALTGDIHIKAATDDEEPKTKPTLAAHATGDIDSEFYQRFLSVVERELSNADLSIEELATKMGLSRVQFYRKIKALTNYSPGELLRNIRLRRADTMLKTGEATISEIAYAVGFSSPSYFTKSYHDFFGESPTDVRRRFT